MERTNLLAAKVKTKTSIVGNEGFTLLELLLVIFILVIAASLVFISTGRLHDKTIFNEEARRLVQTIKHARNLSLMERINVALKIDEENRQYWIDSGNKQTSDQHTLPQDYILRGESVLFFPKGNSSGGTITLKNAKGQEYHIEIDSVLGTASITRI